MNECEVFWGYERDIGYSISYVCRMFVWGKAKEKNGMTDMWTQRAQKISGLLEKKACHAG